VLVHEDQLIVDLIIDGESLTTTPEHPFYTLEGWEVAGELEVGDHIWSISGEWGRVEAVSVSHDPQLMYNLTVDDAHTFFVGEQAWLVHNPCTPKIYTDSKGNTFNFDEHPDRLTMPNGDEIELPIDAQGPIPTDSGRGFAYINGTGLQTGNSQVVAVRVMPPTPARGNAPAYPYGYYVYMNASGQTVDPVTGRVVHPSDPNAHIPLSPP
jgi:hypothetical protein